MNTYQGDPLGTDTKRLSVEPSAGNPPLHFPKGFLWGTSTAATQVDGDVSNEWTDFTALDGKNCHQACDHFHRYREDIAWMQRLGIKSYRMSVEWSRLQSEPYAPLDNNELERLRDVLDCLRAADITPMIVLHHFSNPLWIYRNGGWTNPATIPAFDDFVSKLVSVLRDRVRIWNTFNEPDTYGSCSYLLGEFPPLKKIRLHSFHAVINHMGIAHRRACEVIRRAGSSLGDVEVGFTKNWTHFGTLKPNRPWDWFMAKTCHCIFNGSVLNAFTREGRNEAATFQGLNYYGQVRFHNFHSLTPARGRSREDLAQLGVYCDDMFERYPAGMSAALHEINRRNKLPIYITEHGSTCSDEGFRIADLRANLTSVRSAIAEGVDVRGFYYWTLMDNFEWQFGYTKKFGLLSVDFDDAHLTRKEKPIAAVFQKACQLNCVP